MTASLTLGGMFERTSKSSLDAAPDLELSPRADIGDPTGMRGAQLREWRDAIAEIADELEVVLRLATLRVSPPRSTPPRS